MAEFPVPCLLCRKPPKVDENGNPLEQYYFYQRKNGILKVVPHPVIGAPIFVIHVECEPE